MIDRRQFCKLAMASAGSLFVPRLASSTQLESNWDRFVSLVLQDRLWQREFAYDAGHHLVPALFHAFQYGTAGRMEFSLHFQRFISEDEQSLETIEFRQEQIRQHYLFLACLFVNLAKHSDPGLIPPGLEDRLARELLAHWRSKPQWWYKPRRISGGIRGRLVWKLEQKHPEKSYFNAVTDHDLFSLCSLCLMDLGHETHDAAALMARVLNERGSHQPDGGWLFQTNVWKDHPDYAYVGNPQLSNNLDKLGRESVNEDASHSHRWPIFLYAYLQAAKGPDRELGLNVLRKLNYQFFTKVFIPANSDVRYPRIRNFMDGWNGVYRYKYSTTGANNYLGYGPSMLSGILPVGWWGFLPGAQDHWKQFAESFPLPNAAVELYTGPNTTRKRHKLFKLPSYFADGFAELNVRMVSEVRLFS